MVFFFKQNEQIYRKMGVLQGFSRLSESLRGRNTQAGPYLVKGLLLHIRLSDTWGESVKNKENYSFLHFLSGFCLLVLALNLSPDVSLLCIILHLFALFLWRVVSVHPVDCVLL